MEIRDGDWTLFKHDPVTGVTVWHYCDGVHDHFRTDTPVEHILRANVAEANHMAGQRFGEGKRVASIPLGQYFRDLQPAVAQGDDKYLSRWLNDGDNRKFRTFEGDV